MGTLIVCHLLTLLSLFSLLTWQFKYDHVKAINNYDPTMRTAILLVLWGLKTSIKFYISIPFFWQFHTLYKLQCFSHAHCRTILDWGTFIDNNVLHRVLLSPYSCIYISELKETLEIFFICRFPCPAEKLYVVGNKNSEAYTQRKRLTFAKLWDFTSLPVTLFSGLQSGLIPIPSTPILLAGKAQTRTCKDNIPHHIIIIYISPLWWIIIQVVSWNFQR